MSPNDVKRLKHRCWYEANDTARAVDRILKLRQWSRADFPDPSVSMFNAFWGLEITHNQYLRSDHHDWNIWASWCHAGKTSQIAGSTEGRPQLLPHHEEPVGQWLVRFRATNRLTGNWQPRLIRDLCILVPEHHTVTGPLGESCDGSIAVVLPTRLMGKHNRGCVHLNITLKNSTALVNAPEARRLLGLVEYLAVVKPEDFQEGVPTPCESPVFS